MKKALTIFALAMIILAACGKSKDEPPPQTEQPLSKIDEKKLAKRWGWGSSLASLRIEFNSDKTGVQRRIKNSLTGESEDYPFTWNTKGDSVQKHYIGFNTA